MKMVAPVKEKGSCGCKGECAAVAAQTIKQLKSTVEMLVQQLKEVNARLAAAEKRNAASADEKSDAGAKGSEVIVAAVDQEKGVYKDDTYEQEKPKAVVELKEKVVKEKTMVLNVASIAADGTGVMGEPKVQRSVAEADTTLGGNDITSVKLQAADVMKAESVGEREATFPKTGVGIGNAVEPVDSEKHVEGVE
ncbi:unnamed protein product [Closterium sp. Naga37s-1]|nr:unnamed protein product [Closterium sp. Naga37s-1]